MSNKVKSVIKNNQQKLHKKNKLKKLNKGNKMSKKWYFINNPIYFISLIFYKNYCVLINQFG